MILITPELRQALTEGTPYVFIPTDRPAWVINHGDLTTEYGACGSDNQSIVWFDQYDNLVSNTYYPENW